MLGGGEPLIGVPGGYAEHRGQLLRPDAVPVDQREHLPMTGRKLPQHGADGAVRGPAAGGRCAGRAARSGGRDRQGLLPRGRNQPGPEQVRRWRQLPRVRQRGAGGTRRDSVGADEGPAVVEHVGRVYGVALGETAGVNAIGPRPDRGRRLGGLDLLGHRASW